MDYTESCVTDAYRGELNAPSEQAAQRTIFELLEEDRPAPPPDIVFTADSAEFSAQSDMEAGRKETDYDAHG